MDAQLIIAGNLQNSGTGSSREVFSPWEGQKIGSIQLASPDQAKIVLESSDLAFQHWRRTSISHRVKLLLRAIENIKKAKEDIALALCLEIGKTIEEARSEIDRALEYIELTTEALKLMKGAIYYGDVFDKYPRSRKTGYYSREPIGVMLMISPFNYPINLSVTKVAPALAAGNTVVIKPASIGTLASFLFYKAFNEAGYPPGVISFISGNSYDIGDLLVTAPQIKLIAFTGSTSVGNHIRDISKGVPLLLELGGKDAAIVTAQADLYYAAQEIVSGAFSYAGQRCTAQKMVFVYQEVAERLEDMIISQTKKWPLLPLINNESADYIEELIADAETKGAMAVLRGKREGNKMSPSLLTEVNKEMRIFTEEQFGPVLPIIKVKDEAEALELANLSHFGLQASVYTENIEEAYRIADKLEVGTVQINGRPDRGPDNFPFGGVKDSGQLMQGLTESLDLMTRGKLTVFNLRKT